jgi:hypothetical protein
MPYAGLKLVIAGKNQLLQGNRIKLLQQTVASLL